MGACQSLTIIGSHSVATLNPDTSICLVSVGASACFSEQQLPVFGSRNCGHVGQSDDDPICRVACDSFCAVKCCRQHGFNEEFSGRGSPGLRKQHSQKSWPFAAAHLHSICGSPAPRMNGIIPTTSTFQRIWRTAFITSPRRKFKRVAFFDADVADRFHAIHDFCQDGLGTLFLSAATSWGRESTIPRSPNLLKASRVPANRPPIRQSFATRWLLSCRARMLPPKASAENRLAPSFGGKA